ncbi:RNA polymerase sigma factor [Sphingorhabdus sp. Alg239-R122]|uniref:RNA polymerase sigma factor n=1 Tax=Sphingorhabdus sp. Alg239-R122 TaxID=2305989 RepID=UPI0019687A59|nr:RNA polymerase sigma factor [Sphingorhabdus sp. Alg239-R122]
MAAKRDTRYVLSDYLVASARLGERHAWNWLYRLWHKRFVAHAWRLCGDANTAQDHVQDAWAEIYSSLGKLSNDRAFAAWAYRIVTRKVMRGQKQAARETALPMEVLEQATSDDGVAKDETQTRLMLTQAVAQLPPEQRAAIALFYGQGMRIAEIAVATDAPVGTVKTRLMHARQKLKDILKGE